MSPLAPYKVQFHSRAMSMEGGGAESRLRYRGVPRGKASKNLDFVFFYLFIFGFFLCHRMRRMFHSLNQVKVGEWP